LEYTSHDEKELKELKSAMAVFLQNYSLNGEGSVLVQKCVGTIFYKVDGTLNSMQSKGKKEGKFVYYCKSDTRECKFKIKGNSYSINFV